MFERRRVGFLPVLLVIVLPLIVACGGDVSQPTEEAGLGDALPETYGMAVVRTSTPTPDPARTDVAEAATFPLPLGTVAPTVEPTKADSAGVRRIDIQEARAKADAGEAVIVDVRALPSYEQGHIAGAISMPSNEVATRYGELPADKLVVFY